jgi:hypothetical protein
VGVHVALAVLDSLGAAAVGGTENAAALAVGPLDDSAGLAAEWLDPTATNEAAIAIAATDVPTRTNLTQVLTFLDIAAHHSGCGGWAFRLSDPRLDNDQ